MPLEPGARLGPYEVVSPLGAGGMGEVYRARDTKLDRDVALKVLPEAFTADTDRLARFEREAKVLASLNHPHIGHIYGLEEADGQKALVLELVEGPTLADRIARGPIPLDEALPIAKQIAEALEAAHEQGIIHRDLKPANVKVKADGTVKVLDFGLAKAHEPEDEAQDDSQSPTLSARATQAGVILGTAAYMSPEQARGKPVDKRADIWAFGAVLYEMLTARRAFAGSDVTDTLASVLRSEPEWTVLPPTMPPPIQRLLRRCLEKQARNRLQHIGDARLEIEEALAEGESVNVAQGRPSLLSHSGLLLAAAAVAVAVGLALGFVLGRRGDRPMPPVWSSSAPTTRTEVTLPASASLSLGTHYPLVGFESPVVALSPDGRHLVYVGQSGEGTLLFHRDLTKAEDPRPVPGTEEALFAFFSPDSSELGFLTSDRVRKVALDGRAATTLCGARMPVFATWMDERIYFSDASGTVLMMVPATGGEPSQLYSTAPSWGFVRSVLPGGQAALVSLYSPLSTSLDYAPIRIVFFDGREDRPLPVTGFDPRILPDGHLIFGRGGSLLAVPFDAQRFELRGEPVPVLEGAAMESIFGNLHIAASDNGALAVVPGRDVASGRLAWVDRQGRQGTLEIPDRVYGTFDMTADEKKFAVQVADVQDYVWIWDGEAGGRALPYGGGAGWPLWSPSADALAFVAMDKSGASEVSRASRVMRQDLRGGPAQELFARDEMLTVESWVRPGLIGVTGFVPSRVGALEDRPPNGSRWIDSREDGSLGVWGGSLSPGGEWIAYMSKEGTGRDQVWIEEMDGGRRQQVSTDGGVEPSWCLSCGELYYRQGNRIFASRIELDPQLEVGPPRQAFVAPDFVDTGGLSYRVSADGERLYYVRRQPTVRDRILIIQNWFSELERLAPTN